MATDRFLIAPFDKESGLQRNVKPFLIPDSAFSELNNAYVFRGRVRKRFGSRWMGNTQLESRFRIKLPVKSNASTGNWSGKVPLCSYNLGLTDGTGAASGTVPGGTYGLGQYFIIGAETDTVTVLGTPGIMTRTGGSSTTHTFNTTTGAYVFAGAPANTAIYFYNLSPIATPAIGQMFSIGSEVFTVNALNVGVTPAPMLRSGSSTKATYDTLATAGGGSVVIEGSEKDKDVYFYPSLPVMGLQTFDNSNITDATLIGFDTRFAYTYSGGWDRLSGETAPGDARWSGNNSQFFWGCTWTGLTPDVKVFFTTNFNQAEPNNMRSLTGTTWKTFKPEVKSGHFMIAARIIVLFKNRLVAFNTWEGAAGTEVNYPNRARYSQVGSPLEATAWRQDIRGKGNAIDCPAEGHIVTVEFLKDRLIVFFQNSTWELVYVGNQAYPFAWQQINTELGVESVSSVVPFDKAVIGLGVVGIHACTGANVTRIDEKIPREIFAVHNKDEGPLRVYGIRDYYVEMVYWSIPDTSRSSTVPYPNRVLIYNYASGTWAYNDDSITCFGYYHPITPGVTWDSEVITWDSNLTWDSGALSAGFKQVVAGNQEGYTFIIDNDCTTNAPVLQITNMSVTGNNITITSIDHNLQQGDYVYLQDIVATGTLDDINDTIFPISNVTPHTFTIMTTTALTGVYQGNGTIARVSNISIKTKEYNFYMDSGRNAYISKIDFHVDRTTAGAIDVDYYVSTSSTPMLSLGSGTKLGTGTLTTSAYALAPFELKSTRVWHPIYLQAAGEVIQLHLKFNDTQMRDTVLRESGFQLHGMVFHSTPSSARLQ